MQQTALTGSSRAAEFAESLDAAPALRPSQSEEVAESSRASDLIELAAQNRELRAELEQIRAQRDRLAESQARVMELFHVQSPDKLLHDIRNVLNERELLKALVGDM